MWAPENDTAADLTFTSEEKHVLCSPQQVHGLRAAGGGIMGNQDGSFIQPVFPVIDILVWVPQYDSEETQADGDGGPLCFPIKKVEQDSVWLNRLWLTCLKLCDADTDPQTRTGCGGAWSPTFTPVRLEFDSKNDRKLFAASGAMVVVMQMMLIFTVTSFTCMWELRSAMTFLFLSETEELGLISQLNSVAVSFLETKSSLHSSSPGRCVTSSLWFSDPPTC